MESIPFRYSDYMEKPCFKPLHEVIRLFQKKNEIEARNLLTKYMADLLTTTPTDTREQQEIALAFLIISEIPKIDNEIYNIALDSMIAFEEHTLTNEKRNQFLGLLKKYKANPEGLA